MKRGDKCQLVFEAEVNGTRNSDYEYDKGVHADFKLKKGSIMPTGKAENYKTIQRAHQAALEEQAKGE